MPGILPASRSDELSQPALSNSESRSTWENTLYAAKKYISFTNSDESLRIVKSKCGKEIADYEKCLQLSTEGSRHNPPSDTTGKSDAANMLIYATYTNISFPMPTVNAAFEAHCAKSLRALYECTNAAQLPK